MSDFFPKNPHLLIVDDTPQNIQILGKTLREEGYEITVATNGAQALKITEKIHPDLILLDVMMPEMDGFETCQKLKEVPETSSIPVIFLTALTDSDNIVKGFDSGAVDYITKPFRTSEVIARVKTQLELKFGRELILQKNNEQKELLHILCHDLANPIGAISSFLNFIKAHPDRLSKHLEIMILAIGNASEMIELVRAMRELEEEKLPMGPLNLKEAILQSCAILQEKFSEKQVELVQEVSGEMLVHVEKTSFINSVLNNIFTNAIKFSMPGSKIEVSARQEGDAITIKVRDFGIGMSAELLRNLFDISKNTSRKGTRGEIGTGFGMPMMKKFIKAYQGNIDITSREKQEGSSDHGTVITLILKAA
ncbi:MAG: hybrid sensor histidine kinase/response regulator [SAR324 cluster bacterium]|nr:hybrid sensor histidine kinase/response regulator [SAR324 cluster bacterium]